MPEAIEQVQEEIEEIEEEIEEVETDLVEAENDKDLEWQTRLENQQTELKNQLTELNQKLSRFLEQKPQTEQENQPQENQPKTEQPKAPVAQVLNLEIPPQENPSNVDAVDHEKPKTLGQRRKEKRLARKNQNQTQNKQQK